MKAFLSTGGGRSKGGSPVQCIEQAASHPLHVFFSFSLLAMSFAAITKSWNLTDGYLGLVSWAYKRQGLAF